MPLRDDLTAPARLTINKHISKLTEKYQHVRYGLGCYAQVADGSMSFADHDVHVPRRGTIHCDGNMVQCSSWVQALYRIALTNFPVGWRRMIWDALGSTSEGQIANLEKLGATVRVGQEITEDLLDGGWLVGMDSGHSDWEGKRDRGINHIFAAYRDADGSLFLSESGSSGDPDGVGIRAWSTWMTNNGHLHNADKVFAVDIMEVPGLLEKRFDRMVVRRAARSAGVELDHNEDDDPNDGILSADSAASVIEDEQYNQLMKEAGVS